MQFNFVTLAIAALVASAAAHNATNTTIIGGHNSTNGSGSPLVQPESGALQNAVSGGLLGAVIAGGLALVL